MHNYKTETLFKAMDSTLLTSKNWKDRSTFYTTYDWTLPDHLSILKNISGETIVPALEPALRCILTCPVVDYHNCKAIIKHIGQVKLKELFKILYIRAINYELFGTVISYDVIRSDVIWNGICNMRIEGVKLVECGFLKHIGDLRNIYSNKDQKKFESINDDKYIYQKNSDLDEVNNLNNSRNSIIVKLDDLARIEQNKISEVMNDIVDNIKTSKNAKVTQIYCEILFDLTVLYGPLFERDVLTVLLGHSDPIVRKEGNELVILIYCIIDKNIFTNLNNVKELQMRELNERFVEIDIKMKLITITENITTVQNNKITLKDDHIGSQAGRFSEFKNDFKEKIEDTKTPKINEKYINFRNNAKILINRNATMEIPENVTKMLSSQNYKERLSAFQNVLKYPYKISNEVVKQILLKINDANLQVSHAAIECVLFLKINKETIKILIERLKEKKLKEIIFCVLKEKEIKSTEIIGNSLCEMKNPQMKSFVLEYLKDDFSNYNDFVVNEIIKAIEDSSGEVRKNAFECLQQIIGTKYEDKLPKKIRDKLLKDALTKNNNATNKKINNNTYNNNNISNKNNKFNTIGKKYTENNNINATEKDITAIKENVNSDNKNTRSEIKKREINLSNFQILNEKEIIPYFAEKFLFIKDTNSMQRLENFETSKISEETDFLKFICIYKDSFFKINLFFIEYIIKKIIKKEEIKFIVEFWIEKISENKLKEKIYELIKKCHQLDGEIVCYVIQEFIKKKKLGKVFCEGVKILGEIGNIDNLDFLNLVEKKGKLERDCVAEAIDKIQSRQNNNHTTNDLALMNTNFTVSNKPRFQQENYTEDNFDNNITGYVKALDTAKMNYNETTHLNTSKDTNKNINNNIYHNVDNNKYNLDKNVENNRFNANNMGQNRDNYDNMDTDQTSHKKSTNIVEEQGLHLMSKKNQNNNIEEINSKLVKRKHSLLQPKIIKSKIKNRIKDCKNKEMIFTPEFINILNSRRDEDVLRLFDTCDKIFISDFIIEYLYQMRSVNLSYVEDLINNFIKREYILNKNEAEMLYQIVKDCDMLISKLELIFPRSKLKRIIEISYDKIDILNSSMLSFNINNSNIESPCKRVKEERRFSSFDRFENIISEVSNDYNITNDGEANCKPIDNKALNNHKYIISSNSVTNDKAQINCNACNSSDESNQSLNHKGYDRYAKDIKSNEKLNSLFSYTNKKQNENSFKKEFDDTKTIKINSSEFLVNDASCNKLNTSFVDELVDENQTNRNYIEYKNITNNYINDFMQNNELNKNKEIFIHKNKIMQKNNSLFCSLNNEVLKNNEIVNIQNNTKNDEINKNEIINNELWKEKDYLLPDINNFIHNSHGGVVGINGKNNDYALNNFKHDNDNIINHAMCNSLKHEKQIIANYNITIGYKHDPYSHVITDKQGPNCNETQRNFNFDNINSVLENNLEINENYKNKLAENTISQEIVLDKKNIDNQSSNNVNLSKHKNINGNFIEHENPNVNSMQLNIPDKIIGINCDDEQKPMNKSKGEKNMVQNYFKLINGEIKNYNVNKSFVQGDLSYMKYKKEFEENTFKPIDRAELEKIFINLIESDRNVCLEAFNKLNLIINEEIRVLYFSCNSLVSSILIQLNDSLDNDNEISYLIMNTLNKLSLNLNFLKELSHNSVQNIVIDLIHIVSENKNTTILNIAGDILLNICLLPDKKEILKVYLSILNKINENDKKILIKLIWKHSKTINDIMSNKNHVQDIIDVVNEYFESHCSEIARSDVLTLKAIQLHLIEICDYYKMGIYDFELKGMVKKIVDKILDKIKTRSK